MTPGQIDAAPHQTSVVLYERRGALGWITLNRPMALNAVNGAMRQQLPVAVRQAESDPDVRVLVVTGAGERAFSAGADVKEWRAEPDVVTARQRRVRESWLSDLSEATKPSVAAIHGYCLGGGLELALACDLRIAADNARLALPELGLGILPGSGGTQRLSRLVGLGHALHLILTGEQIDAEEAFRIGLVTKVVAPDGLLAEAERLGNLIASRAPLSLALAREAIYKGHDLDLASGLRLEADLASLLLTTEDRLEAAAAFREKRRPVFKGR